MREGAQRARGRSLPAAERNAPERGLTTERIQQVRDFIWGVGIVAFALWGWRLVAVPICMVMGWC